MNVVDIRNNLADAINRVVYTGERIVLERRGKGVAALVSVEDLALLEELENQGDIRAARKGAQGKRRRSIGENQGTPGDEITWPLSGNFQAVSGQGVGASCPRAYKSGSRLPRKNWATVRSRPVA